MSKKTNVAIAGANGRMGQELLTACLNSSDAELTAALLRDGNALIGKRVITESASLKPADADYLSKNLKYSSQELPLNSDIDVLIDFTLPDNTLKNIERCIKNHVAIVIGTTGFSDEQQIQIDKASKHIPVLQASNMSIGVNLTLALLEKTAKALGSEIRISIEDTHHIHKLDSPSGTAISLAKVITDSQGRCYEDSVNIIEVKTDEVTNTNNLSEDKINIISKREGEVVGDHKTIFKLDDETIEINHFAHNRQIFAKGAIKAALFLAGKEAGSYSMKDVLGL